MATEDPAFAGLDLQYAGYAGDRPVYIVRTLAADIPRKDLVDDLAADVYYRGGTGALALTKSLAQRRRAALAWIMLRADLRSPEAAAMLDALVRDDSYAPDVAALRAVAAPYARGLQLLAEFMGRSTTRKAETASPHHALVDRFLLCGGMDEYMPNGQLTLKQAGYDAALRSVTMLLFFDEARTRHWSFNVAELDAAAWDDTQPNLQALARVTEFRTAVANRPRPAAVLWVLLANGASPAFLRSAVLPAAALWPRCSDIEVLVLIGLFAATVPRTVEEEAHVERLERVMWGPAVGAPKTSPVTMLETSFDAACM